MNCPISHSLPRWPDHGETDWEGKYLAGEAQWDKGEASPGLVDFLAATRDRSDLPRGAVLVPGCGTGHDVRAFAAAGFDATGLDIAPSAVERARALTAAGVRARFHLGNFLDDSPAAPFDWVFEHTCFCAINPARRGDYVAAVARWLRPGGNYLAVNYLIPDTDGPPFGTTREEVVARFSPWFDLLEEWVPRSYPNRTGLERMFLWRLRAPGAG